MYRTRYLGLLCHGENHPEIGLIDVSLCSCNISPAVFWGVGGWGGVQCKLILLLVRAELCLTKAFNLQRIRLTHYIGNPKIRPATGSYLDLFFSNNWYCFIPCSSLLCMVKFWRLKSVLYYQWKFLKKCNAFIYVVFSLSHRAILGWFYMQWRNMKGLSHS